jgi:hypothetical protein
MKSQALKRIVASGVIILALAFTGLGRPVASKRPARSEQRRSAAAPLRGFGVAVRQPGLEMAARSGQIGLMRSDTAFGGGRRQALTA